MFFKSLPKMQSFINHSSRQTLQLRYLYTFQSNPQIQRLLEQTATLKQEIEEKYAVADIDLKIVLHQKLRSLWTYHSNAIDGSILSLEDTIFFLKEGLTVNGIPFKDLTNAQNHAKAINYMYEAINQSHPINIDLVKKINAILLNGVDSIPTLDSHNKKNHESPHPDHYKTLVNHILPSSQTIHRYIEPYQDHSEMNILFDWIEKNIVQLHPVVTAAVTHYNMLRINPFADNNGRGARILMNLILLRGHYMPAIINLENKSEYIMCLAQADKGDINPFINFVAKSLIESEKAILNELNKYSHLTISTPKLN